MIATLKLPWVFDAAFLVAWTLQSLGQVTGFFGTFSWWHILVHVSLPAVLAPTALIVLIRLRLISDVNFATHYDPTKAHALTDVSANAAGGLLGGLWLAAWAGRRARSGSARGRGIERGQSGSHLITSRAHRGRRSGGRPRHTY